MKKKILIKLGIALLIISLYLIIQNTWIQMEEIVIEKNGRANNREIKIVQVSDIHLKKDGKIIKKVVNNIKKQKPDLIVLTGDIIDSSANINESKLGELAKGLSEIATTYAITGNHEVWNRNVGQWKELLEANGVHVLMNQNRVIDVNGKIINIIGIADSEGIEVNNIEFLNNNIILCHRPERVEEFLHKTNIKDKNTILFAGHAHGGQFRIPFTQKGIVAPGQGFFPEYTSGVYTFHNLTMIVSRGIGNSIIPFRINNRPHIPVVIMKI